MALGPGGGGGGPVGVSNSFTGAAEALEVAGDFAYAYSGQHQMSTTAVEHLKFTTGNYLFVGEFQFFGPVQFSSGQIDNGDFGGVQISFNEAALFIGKVDTKEEDSPTEIKGPLIIPAYTEVLVEVVSSATTAGFFTSVNLMGRIYK